MEAEAAILPDGRRLHLHHGPIDLILETTGDRRVAYGRATARFQTILSELVADLPDLRAPYAAERTFTSPVARRIQNSLAPFADRFVTPMAGIAGAVADEMLGVLAGDGPDKAYVNNGGDIALTLRRGVFRALGAAGEVEIRPDDPARGLATSGWGGRSWSLGIADAVTVLARDCVTADVAATLIANAVDLPGHPCVTRLPADTLSEDTDLGARPVTVDVGPLTQAEITTALSRGAAYAADLRDAGVIEAAALRLKTRTHVLRPTDAPA